MPKTVDARGLTCPQPVINTRKALESESEITVIVDNETARGNVIRMAESLGCSVTDDERDDGIYISVKREAQKGALSQTETEPGLIPREGPFVVTIPCDIMGRGDEKLGAILVRGFIHTLTEATRKPDTIIFFNTGVKLAAKGSDVLDDLKALEKTGTAILVCGTCLNYFELTESLEAGIVSNMYDIVESLSSAGRLITV